MSKEMENDIRKSFLTERLSKFSRVRFLLLLLLLHCQCLDARALLDDGISQHSLTNLFPFMQNVGVDDIRAVALTRTSTETPVVSTASSSGAENSTDLAGVVVADNKDTNNVQDGNSTDDMDDIGDGVDEYMGDSNTMIAIPLAGEECSADCCEDNTTTTTTLRQVANGCAVCLSDFEVDDRIAWSSNECCPHAFHHSCIMDWFVASGSKALKRQRRQEARTGVVEFADDPAKRITSVPMLCPCCRQEFLREAPDDDSDSELECEKTQSNDASAGTQETTTGDQQHSSSTEGGAETRTTPIVTGDEAV